MLRDNSLFYKQHQTGMTVSLGIKQPDKFQASLFTVLWAVAEDKSIP